MRCALAVLLLSLWCASSWAQPAPSASSTSPLPDLPPISRQLSDLATTLERALSDSATDWDLLSQVLTEHSQKLAALAASSTALERETVSMQASLSACESSLLEAMRAALRHSLEAALWRVGALSGALGVVGALADARQVRGAVLGAIVGAASGAVWWVVESRPLRILDR